MLASGGAGPFALRLAGSKPSWLRFDSATVRLSGKAKLKPRKPLIVTRHAKKGVRRIVKHRNAARAHLQPLPHGDRLAGPAEHAEAEADREAVAHERGTELSGE